ncbi:MAG: hypothetical protein NZ844_12700 [Chloroherpetonaceae bacterium]|nr:hypothetical protein [Chloroherpetonaceae bacterium]
MQLTKWLGGRLYGAFGGIYSQTRNTRNASINLGFLLPINPVMEISQLALTPNLSYLSP